MILIACHTCQLIALQALTTVVQNLLPVVGFLPEDRLRCEQQEISKNQKIIVTQ